MFATPQSKTAISHRPARARRFEALCMHYMQAGVEKYSRSEARTFLKTPCVRHRQFFPEYKLKPFLNGRGWSESRNQNCRAKQKSIDVFFLPFFGHLFWRTQQYIMIGCTCLRSVLASIANEARSFRRTRGLARCPKVYVGTSCDKSYSEIVTENYFSQYIDEPFDCSGFLPRCLLNYC